MKNLLLVIILMLAIMATFESCKQDPQGIDTVPLLCFESQIQPIFTGKCNTADCHGGNGESYNFTTYSGIKAGISAGEPYNSPVYKAVTTKWGEIMPPKGYEQLNEEQRTLIYLWILQGATDTVACQ